jgi:Mg2+ and Co2+ transporter CorA
MNVDVLPFHRAGAFSLVFPLLLMFGIAGALILWFRHKRWL